MVLLSRSLDDPFLIPPHVLSSLAHYTHQNLCASLFCQLAEYCIRRINAELESHVSLSSETADMARTLLTLCAHDYRTYRDTMIPLLDSLLSVGHDPTLSLESAVQKLPAVSLLGVIRLLSEHPDMPRFLPFIDILISQILGHTPLVEPVGPNSVGTWTLCRVVIALMDHNERGRALELFQKMLDSGRFPPAATLGMDVIHSPDSDITNVPSAFDIVMLMSIIRACQLYGWNERLLRVAEALISRCNTSTIQPENDMISRVLQNCIQDLIAEGRAASLSNAMHLFKACLENNFIAPPNHHTLDSLYNGLYGREMIAELSDLALYVHCIGKTREVSSSAPNAILISDLEGTIENQGSIGDRYPWPPYTLPQGPACLAVLSHIIHAKRNPSVIKVFAQWHVEHPHVLQTQRSIIPELIVLYAQGGCVKEAIKLWTVYRDGKGAEMLVGNSRAIIALIKALINFATRLEARKSKPRITTNLSAKKDSLATGDATVDPDTGTSAVESDLANVDGCRDVAYEIASSYISLNSPLSMAAHNTLTSIAHISFLIGDPMTASKALSIILDRRTIPDAHDVSVTVGGVALFNPVRAAEVLDGAMERGIDVPKHAWTTILREALVSQDFELAETLLTGLADSGTAIDSHVIDTVIRYGINDGTSLGTADKEDVSKFLEEALSFLTPRGSGGGEHRVWPSLAQLCIRRALDAELPVLAFKFWKTLLKDLTTYEQLYSPSLWSTSTGNTSPTPLTIQKRIGSKLLRAFMRGEADFRWTQGHEMCVTMGLGLQFWRRGMGALVKSGVKVTKGKKSGPGDVFEQINTENCVTSF